MQSWGFCGKDDAMKKLVVDMGLDSLHKEMKVSLMEIASTKGLLGTTLDPTPLFYFKNNLILHY